MVVFWKLLKSKEETNDDKLIPLLRYYNVFNISQNEGIDPSKIPPIDAFDHDFSPSLTAELIIKNWFDCPIIEHGILPIMILNTILITS